MKLNLIAGCVIYADQQHAGCIAFFHLRVAGQRVGMAYIHVLINSQRFGIPADKSIATVLTENSIDIPLFTATVLSSMTFAESFD